MKQNKQKTVKIRLSPTAGGVARGVAGDADITETLPAIRKLLKPYRQRIDALDDKIMAMLGERFGIIREVAAIKSRYNLPSYISERVVEVRERNARAAKKHKIDPGFIRTLYTLMIFESCALEDEIKSQKKSKPVKKNKGRRRAA